MIEEIDRVPHLQVQPGLARTGSLWKGAWGPSQQTGSGHVQIVVRDDGPGFDVADRYGRGLRNMRDRIEAIGGELTVDARPGSGTRVSGTLPLT